MTYLNSIHRVCSYFLQKIVEQRIGLQSLYQRMPVCAGLIWNEDRDELFTKYLEQMDDYTGVWKLTNTIRKASA